MVLALVLLGLFELGNWAAHRLLHIAIILMVAFFISLAMEPAVDALAARGIPRGLGTALIFVVVNGCVVIFALALGVLLVQTVGNGVNELPRLLDQLIDWINSTFNQHLTPNQLRDRLLHDSNNISEYAERAANTGLGISGTVLVGLGELLTIALFSIYITADGPKLRRTVCSVLPPQRQGEVLRAWELAITKTGGYLYSRALLAVISAVCHGVFLALIGIPNALALGIWFGVVASFIPTIGTYVAAALPILVALTDNPVDAIWIIIFAVLYQWFQDYLLQPRITARTVDVNPAVALLAVLCGGALLGAVGAILAIPATATVQAFLSAYVKRYTVEDDPRIERVGRKREREAEARKPSPASE
ncbi:AI-2E family transporter [Nocardia uniformis]|uniref:AI-2E family transporter n=2 Tax=Nocardia uniformis TaxID=53432 RepID=A0A849CHE8_9NOCA|nr:AI-2E family transporter [Nocardia uniformis]